LLLVAAVVGGLVATAGATPSSGDVISTAPQPVAPFTAGIPFASGQNINIVIPANSAFAAPDNTVSINILECSAPNGVIPTKTSACDGNTHQGPTVTATLTAPSP
jgi:hypothetical protein